MNSFHLSDDELQKAALEPGRTSDEWQSHLAACEACRVRLTNYRTLFSGLEQLPVALIDVDPAVVTGQRRGIALVLVLASAIGIIALTIWLNSRFLGQALKGLSMPVFWLMLSAALLITVFSGLVARDTHRRQMRLLD